MSELSINDLFHEIFDENERLIHEFSLNKRCVEVLQKYRQLLSSICFESDSNEDIELRLRFAELENEYKTINEDIKTIIAETESKTTELRNQMNTESEPKEKRVKKSVNMREISETEVISAEEDNENEGQINVKFLSATDHLLEEDSMIITERDPKNPLILGLI